MKATISKHPLTKTTSTQPYKKAGGEDKGIDNCENSIFQRKIQEVISQGSFLKQQADQIKYVQANGQAPMQRKIIWKNNGVSKELETEAKNMALVYISKTQTGKEIYEEVRDAEEKVEIWMQSQGNTQITTKEKIEKVREMPNFQDFRKGFDNDMLIEWNVLSESSIPEGEGAEHWSTAEGFRDTQSSVLGLLHELGHARQMINPEMKKQVAPWHEKQTEAVENRDFALQDLYNQLVELHNLYHHEMQVADEMNEPIRTKYGGDANPGSKRIEEGNFKKVIKQIAGLSKKRGYSGLQTAGLIMDIKEQMKETEQAIERHEQLKMERQLAELSERLRLLNDE